jgi:hypothetical protein
MIDGRQARIYFMVYRALVGAAFIQSTGGERSYSLLRAWSYYARPLTDLLWQDDSDPIAMETAHQLIGWLLWFKDLEDPEGYFRSIMARERALQVVKQTPTL